MHTLFFKMKDPLLIREWALTDFDELIETLGSIVSKEVLLEFNGNSRKVALETDRDASSSLGLLVEW